MSEQNVPPAIDTTLRRQAEQQLRSGTAGLNHAFTASSDALGVLYRLSSAGHTASDGLKLLHELQTYQVELDIQLEQLQQEQHEHRLELACYQQFFHLAPQACLITDGNGVITDSNPAAASRLHTETPSLCGRAVLSLFDVACQPLLSAALAKVQRSRQSSMVKASLHNGIALALAAAGKNQTCNTLQLTIQPGAAHNALLIILT